MIARQRRRAIRQLRRAGQLERALRARNVVRSRREIALRRRRLRHFDRRLRYAAGSDERWMLATTGTSRHTMKAVLAQRREHGRIIDAMIANRTLVLDALVATGIPSVDVPVNSSNRYRVAVRRENEMVLWSLVAAAPYSTYFYFDTDSVSYATRVQHLATAPKDVLRRLAARASVWRVFTFYADEDGVDLIGDLHGCEIEFWRPAQFGDVVRSRRWNRYATTLPREAFTSATRPALPAFTDAVEFPIDLVYTWVDGTDPRWLQRRAETLGLVNLATRHGEAASDARYLSRDELLYSLRSVERYADFVNHVYVVTDQQHPEWLRDDHPRLTVVDHREIFSDRRCLPTFNSHAIESRLHHIPGLSEHYVYFNDDFFLGRRVEPKTFFHGNGLAKFFTSRSLIPVGEPDHVSFKPVDAAAMNGRQVIAAKFGRSPTYKFKHAPYPQLRSVMFDIEDLFPGEVATTSTSHVRSPSDLALASSLHHHVAYLTGRAVPGSISSYYADLGQANLEGRLAHLRRVRRYDTFCLNDTDLGEIDEVAKASLMSEFFRAYFPEPSSFER
ncbi:stealth family protein [soil metagenome]